MLQKIVVVSFVLAVSVMLSGCALLVGGAAVGAGASGTYIYANGEMKTDYAAPLEKTWSAVEKTVADMHGLDVERSKEIAQGTIKAVMSANKATFRVEYKDKNTTTVSIRVGYLGDKLGSQLLHDKIADHLSKDR